ncbi:MAG: triose-phosphate isomerase [Zetaproteobacteria bacterium]|nr:triose-phosphate isomerase [Pseudobdellovibrionaceae bacterium]|tara:strand:- start:213 stop:1001 length:789 start_codon:yes stop_codon:yes gene_type:complete
MISRKQFLIANWKMNHSRDSLKAYLDEFLNELNAPIETILSKVGVVIAPPVSLLHEAQSLFCSKGLFLASQNIFWEESGAYTGEVSAAMVKDAGASYTLIGHSERRQYFHEINLNVEKKIIASFKHGLIPIVCVGETQEQREKGQTEEILKQQLSVLNKKTCVNLKNLIIAYEPVWAIGTGLTASSEQAQEAHTYIRALLAATYDKKQADDVSILYGGSMKPAVTQELMSMNDIDGGLVGGASLSGKSFAQMLNIAYEQLGE